MVVASDEEPALVRLEAAATATALAEYFRDRGNHVLLAVDSLTGFAAAQREIGVAGGEPLDAGGYPASVSSALPRLLQRGGRKGEGSVTAFYTVPSENDAGGGPICEMARSLLDGHLLLEHALDRSGERPAIDLQHSVSRTACELVDREHWDAIRMVRSLLTGCGPNARSIRRGSHRAGRHNRVGGGNSMHSEIGQYMRQDMGTVCPAHDARRTLLKLALQQHSARAA
jgi:flagellum-specific ATP synthase